LKSKLKDKLLFAKPGNSSQLLKNLAGFPAAVERYKKLSLGRENPFSTNYDA
jgi:hypothetical protein